MEKNVTNPTSTLQSTSSSHCEPPLSYQNYRGDNHDTTRSPYHTAASRYPRNNLGPRIRLTTTMWEDENTLCYQVNIKNICVSRRRDNNMVNGTKLLNVTGMSRGKRDGILKNEKGRVVVKVGAMHLKGVWIPFQRACVFASQYKIREPLYPLFVEDPSVFFYMTSLHYPLGPSQHRLSQFYRPTSSFESTSGSPSTPNNSKPQKLNRFNAHESLTTVYHGNYFGFQL
ncbi:transcription regulator HTH, apses-type DNA-binding domain-containing protein [Spinellus fusiger]|nr:transcription regulator HTH, apses-type DNA-binding domain-containing protein [Spinellus fusiger]